MNHFTLSLLTAVLIAFFLVITKPKDPQSESNTVSFIKYSVIAFVCCYGVHVFLTQTTSPVIDMGEPDF